jgi:hypothetical protein
VFACGDLVNKDTCIFSFLLRYFVLKASRESLYFSRMMICDIKILRGILFEDIQLIN